MADTVRVIRGNSKTLDVSVYDAENNLYILGEGELLIFGVKRNPNEEEYIIKKVVTTQTNGEYVVELKPNDTVGLEIGRYVYDVGLESGENYYTVIDASPFVIQPNVTKWGDGT